MSVWQTTADQTLCSLSTRLPAMSDRSWHPEAGRSFADYQGRVSAATTLLAKLLAAIVPSGPPPAPPAPPAPLPEPAAYGFTGSVGACRDGSNSYGSRLESQIEHAGPGFSLVQCQSACLTLGDRLDAYDWGFVNHGATMQGVWCGCWGSSFTPNDNTTINGVRFNYGSGSSARKVCHGNGGNANFCYHRSSIQCSGGGGGGGGACLPGCTCGV